VHQNNTCTPLQKHRTSPDKIATAAIISFGNLMMMMMMMMSNRCKRQPDMAVALQTRQPT
jgi:hypothetical protein